jgi:hypothetical protein
MRTSYLKVIIFVIVLVLVGVACELSSPADPTATIEVALPQEEPPIQEPVEPEPTDPPPLPTATEEPTAEPTEEPTAEPTEEPAEEPTAEPTPQLETPEVVVEPLAYFTENFDGDLSSWTYFLMSGDESKMDLYPEAGYLVFDLQGENLYVYVLYDEYTYTDVRIEVRAENRAKNQNDVSLLCNYTERFGWYEFAIGNDGLYAIWVYSELDGGYFRMASGGSTNINMGRDTNVYSVVCRGNKLELYINGILEREYTDSKYNLREGQVGLGVSSHYVLPILVEVDYFSISVP